MLRRKLSIGNAQFFRRQNERNLQTNAGSRGSVRIRRTLLFRADPDTISKFEISAFSLAKPINQLTFSPKRPLPSTILSPLTSREGDDDDVFTRQSLLPSWLTPTNLDRYLNCEKNRCTVIKMSSQSCRGSDINEKAEIWENEYCLSFLSH